MVVIRISLSAPSEKGQRRPRDNNYYVHFYDNFFFFYNCLIKNNIQGILFIDK